MTGFGSSIVIELFRQHDGIDTSSLYGSYGLCLTFLMLMIIFLSFSFVFAISQSCMAENKSVVENDRRTKSFPRPYVCKEGLVLYTFN